jgi:hypothetical protein
MARFIKLAGVAVVICGLAAPALLPAAQSTSAYDDAAAWLRDYGSFQPVGIQRLTASFKEAERDGLDLEMVVGEKLMQCGTPYMVQVRSGRLYYAAITAQQARATDTESDRIGIGRRKPERHETVDTQVAAIKKAQIDGKRIGSGNITGQVNCTKLRDANSKLCVRLWFRTPGHTTSKFHYLDDPLPENGELRFSFSGEKRDPDDKFTGPIMVFVSVGTLEMKDGGDYTFHLHSNTIATVVDYSPGGVAPPPSE